MKELFSIKDGKDKTVIKYMDGTKGIFPKEYIDRHMFKILESKRTGCGLEELDKIFREGEING